MALYFGFLFVHRPVCVHAHHVATAKGQKLSSRACATAPAHTAENSSVTICLTSLISSHVTMSVPVDLNTRAEKACEIGGRPRPTRPRKQPAHPDWDVPTPREEKSTRNFLSAQEFHAYESNK